MLLFVELLMNFWGTVTINLFNDSSVLMVQEEFIIVNDAEVILIISNHQHISIFLFLPNIFVPQRLTQLSL